MTLLFARELVESCVVTEHFSYPVHTAIWRVVPKALYATELQTKIEKLFAEANNLECSFMYWDNMRKSREEILVAFDKAIAHVKTV